ncbi:unnamed protein product [Cuscuta epithymum]|uniref:Peroxidase n=2 Tax=Cuscuta epithymum TaxID=186058 RepID=A0AAV0BZT7_9ASTE|nr:unnamed protein product [Cuscuta epithymum]
MENKEAKYDDHGHHDHHHLGMIFIMIVIMMVVNNGVGVDGRLRMDYYMMDCPLADFIVKNIVNKHLENDPTLAASLLRMHFHDCFIQGCDASVLIDSSQKNKAEKDSPANLSLRGYEVIDEAKEELEKQCPGVVSCADIVAMAARDAVFFAGGPVYEIPKGRKDGKRSRIEDTRNLPSPTLNSSQLISMLRQRGFTVQEMVALSGTKILRNNSAHSLGAARCASFKQRLSSLDRTHAVDPTIDGRFAETLSRTCSAGDSAEQPFDSTRNTFDNDYFNALRGKRGVLFSDQTLFADPATRSIVNSYAMNQAMFFFHFQQAMVKMGRLNVKEGPQGEVRQNCRVVNN